jgi:hypothetical protein
MDRRELLLEIGRDDALAHEVLFAERHLDETPRFHDEMIRAWHSDAPRVLTMAFRGSAKSTRAEEAICIAAARHAVENVVILAESEQRAIDRVRSIKFEFENNEALQTLFDVRPGAMWGDKKIVLSNNVIIQGYGRGQSLRGVKYLNARPDLIFLDDIETEETVLTPASRDKVKSWFYKTVIGSLRPGGRIRVAATPLDPDALAVNLARDPTWTAKTYPIEHVSPTTAARLPTWPSRFPLDAIDRLKDEFLSAGKHDAFMQEYMCEAVDPSTRVFLPEYFRHVPRAPSWHAVYAVYDPARTVKQTSATTGKVVFSWIGSKLVVWEADAQKWLPDQLVEDVFDVCSRFNPVLVAVEETGLSEWIMQPLRREQVRRGVLVPLRALNAPRGKLDFIRGLQPFFKAGQLEFAGDAVGVQTLKRQLLAFPTGDIDAPNALAYALTLQPQQPVYDAFDGDVHIADHAELIPGAPPWLAVNADATLTTAILCQVQRGATRVLCDWMREGDPGVALSDILKEARLEVASPRHRLAPRSGSPLPTLRLVAPPEHWGDYDTIGLRAAASRLVNELTRGGDLRQGREELRTAMTHSVHGSPAFLVSPRATWTLRALAGGHAYRQHKTAQELASGPYALLMAGLEAFAGLLRAGDEVDTAGHFSYTPEGRRYLSALARAT